MKRFGISFALTLALTSSFVSAAGAAPDPKMRAAVDGFIAALNTGGPAAASCAPSTTIIDEFAPYAWSGPGACAKWLAGYDQVVKSMGMIDVKAIGGKTLYTDGGATLGEIVVATKFTAMMKGKSVWETGAWTFVMSKLHGTWKFTAVGWSHTADNM